MKLERKLQILRVSLMSMVLLSVLILGYALNEIRYYYAVDSKINAAMNASDVAACQNKSLEATSYCLTGYVRTFYNYTIRNEYLYKDGQGSIEDIKKNGGDCYDYNMLYASFARTLGFYAEPFTLDMNGTYHLVTIISDQTGYCLMDQTTYPRCNFIGDYTQYVKGGLIE